MIQPRQRKIGCPVPGFQLARARTLPHSLEGKQQERYGARMHHHTRKCFRGLVHGVIKAAKRAKIQPGQQGCSPQQECSCSASHRLLRNTRKTGLASSSPTQDWRVPLLPCRLASEPFALYRSIQSAKISLQSTERWTASGARYRAGAPR